MDSLELIGCGSWVVLVLGRGWLSARRDVATVRHYDVIALTAALMSVAALGYTLAWNALHPTHPTALRWGVLVINPTTLVVAVLVQFLAWVIGRFSAHYLRDEPRQAQVWVAFLNVQIAVQTLLLADSLTLMFLAYSAIGWSMEALLCFYPERPFALLAARKKVLADRVADVVAIAAVALAIALCGTDSYTQIGELLARAHASGALADHAESATALTATLHWLPWVVGGLGWVVFLRTALMPFHGWLIQVMEAPTPVSAWLHAGVINLGGYLVIQTRDLWNAVPLAQHALVVSGLISALLAAWSMTTRISVKVRLAWSTLSQMGFMLVECGLGLYSFALWHLLAHSVYKAMAFLSASNAVVECESRRLIKAQPPTLASVVLAPALSAALLCALIALTAQCAGLVGVNTTLHWPAWWLGTLAFLSAPYLWQSKAQSLPQALSRALSGMGFVLGAGLLMSVAHLIPLGIVDHPNHAMGVFTGAMVALHYLITALVSLNPNRLPAFHRWCFAGFYCDEIYTRLTLRYWPRALRATPHEP
jgi:NAD(P)H-quinone oxidoreductase subunit 5